MAFAVASLSAQAVTFNNATSPDYFTRFSPNYLSGQIQKELVAGYSGTATFDFWWNDFPAVGQSTPSPARVSFENVAFGAVSFSNFQLALCGADCNTTFAPAAMPLMSTGTTGLGNVWFSGATVLPVGHYLFSYDVRNDNPFDTPLTAALYITAVPEPGTWALMLAGLGIVGWSARRRSGQMATASAA